MDSKENGSDWAPEDVKMYVDEYSRDYSRVKYVAIVSIFKVIVILKNYFHKAPKLLSSQCLGKGSAGSVVK
jgi:hypothetical protein